MRTSRRLVSIFLVSALSACAPAFAREDASADADATSDTLEDATDTTVSSQAIAPFVATPSTATAQTLNAIAEATTNSHASVMNAAGTIATQTAVTAQASSMASQPLAPKTSGLETQQPVGFVEDTIMQVATAGHNAERLYAWGVKGFYTSVDEGAHWLRLGDGAHQTGYEERLIGAEDGTAYLQQAQHETLMVIDPDGHRVSRSLRFATSTMELQARGNTLYWFGTLDEAESGGVVYVRFSTDHAQTWSEARELGSDHNSGDEFTVLANGSIRQGYESQAGCGGGEIAFAELGLHETEGHRFDWPDTPGSWTLAQNGTMFGLDIDNEMTPHGWTGSLVASDGTAIRTLAKIDLGTTGYGSVNAVSNEHVVFVHTVDGIYRVQKNHAQRIAAGVPHDDALQAIDSQDRPLVIHGGRIRRLDRANHWTWLTYPMR